MITVLAITGALVTFQSQKIDAYFQTGFRDVTFLARKERADQRELKKINDDFGQSYRFDTITVAMKEPFKLRLEAQVEDTKALYIINGPKQTIKVPRLRISQKLDLSTAPGRRQTPLDFGLITPSMVKDLFIATFVRFDRASGDPVFDLTYPLALDDYSRQRIWVDKEKKFIVRREWYNQSKRLLATFTYENPVTQGSVSFPTRLTVRNAEDKIAGVTRYENVKLNGGVDDDLFESNK